MSQAARKNPGKNHAENNSGKEYEWETYTLSIQSTEDLKKAESYIEKNPGTRIILDYQNPLINRGGKEKFTEEEHVHSRNMGGATTYEDSNSFGIIQSGGCFEQFQKWMEGKADEIIPEETYLGGKDIYVDKGDGRRDPKVIGFGGRMADAEAPNIYGASWRERPISYETRQNIENDVTPVLPEEIENLTYNIEEETGRSLIDLLRPQGSELNYENLPSASKNKWEETRVPTSCSVYWRPKSSDLGEKKTETAIWPWNN